MNNTILKEVQKQINFELYSSYLYFSMSSWCERNGYRGHANWTRVQAREELYHATYMHDYLIRRGLPSTMTAISEPPNEWNSLLDLMENVLKHERIVTANINELSSMALDNKDHALYQFFTQYVEEQVEEEESVLELVDKLKLADQNSQLIYMIDKELISRTFTPPFGQTE